MPSSTEIADVKPPSGVSRRDFLRAASFITAALALPLGYTERVAEALASPSRPPVLWLEFQDCTGDSESLLRSSRPTPAELILDLVSLNYHETLMAPAGAAAEKSKSDTIANYKGKYLLIVEGSIPTVAQGVHCTIGGRSALQILQEAAAGAAGIIAVGTCSAYGGLPAASPNPTGAVGVRDLIKDKPIVNLPGCPVNAVNLAATITHYLTFGELPAMDTEGRPLFAYGPIIHNNCPRRAHFDAGEFVEEWGDQGARQGWCLYKLGCRGPKAHSNCASVGWNENTSWPIAAGHPCIACTEPGFWDSSTPFYRWLGESYVPKTTRPKRSSAAVGAGIGVGAAGVATAAGAAAMLIQRKRTGAPHPAKGGATSTSGEEG